MLTYAPPPQVEYARAARLASALYGRGHARSVRALREHGSCLFDLHLFRDALTLVDDRYCIRQHTSAYVSIRQHT